MTLRRHLAAIARADAAAAAIDAAAARVWRDLLRVLRTHTSPVEARHATVTVLRRLVPLLRETLGKHLMRQARWAHREATEPLARRLPLRVLRRAVAGRMVAKEAIHEARSVCGAHGGHHRDAPGRSISAMAGPDRAHGGAEDYRLLFAPQREGGECPAGNHRPLLEAGAIDFSTGSAGGLLDALPRGRLVDLLFPPPGEAWVEQVLHQALGGQPWYQALDHAARVAHAGPEHVATTVAVGYSLGQTQAEIAAQVRPLLDGVRYRARRVARTYGLAVANTANLAAHEELGDMVLGYTINATLDANTRPEHRARDQTTYWKRPNRGQKGLEEMPRPPREADGTWAWNCRCWLSPVLDLSG